MDSAIEPPEHLAGMREVARLAEDFPLKRDHGIRADDQRARLQSRDRARF